MSEFPSRDQGPPFGMAGYRNKSRSKIEIPFSRRNRGKRGDGYFRAKCTPKLTLTLHPTQPAEEEESDETGGGGDGGGVCVSIIARLFVCGKKETLPSITGQRVIGGGGALIFGKSRRTVLEIFSFPAKGEIC